MCAYAIFSYSHFVPQQLNLLYSAQSWPDSGIESLVAWWTGLNYVRMVLGGRLAVRIAGVVIVGDPACRA